MIFIVHVLEVILSVLRDPDASRNHEEHSVFFQQNMGTSFFSTIDTRMLSLEILIFRHFLKSHSEYFIAALLFRPVPQCRCMASGKLILEIFYSRIRLFK